MPFNNKIKIFRFDKYNNRKFFILMFLKYFIFSSTSNVINIIAFLSAIYFKSFTLTFLAEWGDRSQITTIILGAREDVYGVILGGILGHAICTGIAVIGGRLLAQRISVRTGWFFFWVFMTKATYLFKVNFYA